MNRANNLKPGDIEVEFGVPILGEILPSDQWAKTAIKRLPETGPLDWQAVFGRSAPRIVDLGCGNGRFVVSAAVRRPAHDHIGIDILPVVIRYATRRANQRGLSNVRFAVCGAYEFLQRYVAQQSLTEVHIYHPQPFHQQERANRRLLSPDFLSVVSRSLKPEGRLLIQTDNSEYWQFLLPVLSSLFEFHVQDGAWPDDPQGRTRREIMARAKGLKVFRGWAKPRTDVDSEQLDRLAADLPVPDFTTSKKKGTADKSRRRRRH